MNNPKANEICEHIKNELEILKQYYVVDMDKEEFKALTPEQLSHYEDVIVPNTNKMNAILAKTAVYLLEYVDTFCEDKPIIDFDSCVTYIGTALAQLVCKRPITDLLGDESEWADAESIDSALLLNDNERYSLKVGEILTFKFKDYTYDVKVESLQKNKRYNAIIRINKNKDLCINLNALALRDNGECVYDTACMRFITFPYQVKNPDIIDISAVKDKKDIHEYIEAMSNTLDGYPLPLSVLNDYITSQDSDNGVINLNNIKNK